ncbi:hypothetical protein [Streptomyces sp. NPDC048361]|uniref:hypothetical protein n=1 Tax=Streptomyces sp. NPDC048361 TaxID=3154720 RepID=UPI003434BB9F
MRSPVPKSGSLDGEFILTRPDGRISFEALQRRAATRRPSAARLAAETPAYFVAFFVLQADATPC